MVVWIKFFQISLFIIFNLVFYLTEAVQINISDFNLHIFRVVSEATLALITQWPVVTEQGLAQGNHREVDEGGQGIKLLSKYQNNRMNVYRLCSFAALEHARLDRSIANVRLWRNFY